MRGAVFIETIKQTWQQMLYWGIGLAAVGVLVVIMVPLLDMQQIVDLLSTLPPVLIGAMGVGDDLQLFASPEGFVAIGFFAKFALIFSVYPVVMGMRITANEEDEGILDVLMSLPINRAGFIIEKFAAYVVSIIGIVIMIYLGMSLGVAISGVQLDMSKLASVIWNLVPVLTFVMAVTMFVATLVRRKQVALTIVTGFVISSYMIQTVASMAQGSTIAEAFGTFSYFTYYNAGSILKDGLILSHVIGMFAISAILLFAALYLFDRRDLGL